ncbi:MAG: alpha/beta hydrolase [Panacagrimonas sp.]
MSQALPRAGETRTELMSGPAGHIEYALSAPLTAARGVAVFCHPHPLFGGAMSNKVVYSLASSAQKLGFLSLRFNFRGVGRSQGAHDAARGETQDCVHVAQWLRAQAPGLPLLLGGFSFGAFVSLNASAQIRPAGLISVAPPFGRYFNDAPLPAHPACPWISLHSRDDEVVAFDETAAILNSYSPPPEQHVVDGAGHFFHGRLQDVQALVEAMVRKLDFPV